MKTNGVILQLIGMVAGVLGICSGLISSDYGNRFTMVVVSIVVWALFQGIGVALSRLEDMVVDTRRSAAANERAAQAIERMAGVSATVIPPAQPLPRIHSIVPPGTHLEKLLGRRP